MKSLDKVNRVSMDSAGFMDFKISPFMRAGKYKYSYRSTSMFPPVKNSPHYIIDDTVQMSMYNCI